MGFEKIWQKQSQVKELKVAILDDMRVATATHSGAASITETCPKIIHLDLSRNLFETFGPVVEICRNLPALKKLSIKCVMSPLPESACLTTPGFCCLKSPG